MFVKFKYIIVTVRCGLNRGNPNHVHSTVWLCVKTLLSLGWQTPLDCKNFGGLFARVNENNCCYLLLLFYYLFLQTALILAMKKNCHCATKMAGPDGLFFCISFTDFGWKSTEFCKMDLNVMKSVKWTTTLSLSAERICWSRYCVGLLIGLSFSVCIGRLDCSKLNIPIQTLSFFKKTLPSVDVLAQSLVTYKHLLYIHVMFPVSVLNSVTVINHLEEDEEEEEQKTRLLWLGLGEMAEKMKSFFPPEWLTDSRFLFIYLFYV